MQVRKTKIQKGCLFVHSPTKGLAPRCLLRQRLLSAPGLPEGCVARGGRFVLHSVLGTYFIN